MQFRKILELIAFGSLVANADAYTSVYSKVSKHWQAANLLKELSEVNPQFYPVPVIEVPSEGPGPPIRHKKREGDFLTKEEFPEVYGRCGVMAHAANPYGKGIDYAYYSKALPSWRTRIMNLLSNHEIHLLNRPGMYVIHMKEEGDDEVHWYKFQPPPPQSGLWTKFHSSYPKPLLRVRRFRRREVLLCFTLASSRACSGGSAVPADPAAVAFYGLRLALSVAEGRSASRIPVESLGLHRNSTPLCLSAARNHPRDVRLRRGDLTPPFPS